ncbi:NMDA receptor synaptonuclear signaling and neuronal migration factor isoform X2 [Nematostella vectensis]|uniref:NMDA receptor synaptonuclear signaling and neuronal migration factor isoform X2 n=1 Tax=Nematostella vectensis TaxID=45351 RepID=UPI0020772C49|nr:NMDA receptor synaptonuclear signaling and neuronal migration factor isoform X2 [Nematostella vectensis]
MGAIVSSKKTPRARIENKAIAVNAFTSSRPKGDEQSVQETPPPPTKHHNSPNPTPSRGDDSTSVAVSSWGEGVVGTSSHALHNTGEVTSRGVSKDVTTSKELYPEVNIPRDQNSNETWGSRQNGRVYTGFAVVTPLRPEDAAVVIQSTFRGYITRKDMSKRQEASVMIQRHVRGYQTRKELKSQQQAAALIQNKYRKYRKTKQDGEASGRNTADNVGSSSCEEEEEPSKPEYRKPWNEATPTSHVIDKDVKIGEKTKESFNMYQGDITYLKWKTEQQIERTTMGDDYVPPRVLVIVNENVTKICYDFNSTTLNSLLEKVHEVLEAYRSKSKAHSIGFACLGGPGFINPVKGKIMTKVKVQHDQEMASFWKTLGTMMTKLYPRDDVTIHVIGNNVAGNKQGEKLLKFISKFMLPSQVSVESPLEMSAAGKEMINLYFDHVKYKMWRSRMHSKVAFAL